MRTALAFWVLLGLAAVTRANEDPDTEVARKHFNAGRSFYDKGEYEKALDEFQAARHVRPHPALDYNIARCLDRLERYQEAIAAYETYAATNPPDVVEIRTRVAQLKERLKSEPPTRPRQPPPQRPQRETLLVPSVFSTPTAPPPPKSNKKTVAIVLGVIGGALVISAGIAVGLLVKTTTEAATPDSTNGPHPGTQ
jgi:tetratricopeptide (TPR) repeat protein